MITSASASSFSLLAWTGVVICWMVEGLRREWKAGLGAGVVVKGRDRWVRRRVKVGRRRCMLLAIVCNIMWDRYDSWGCITAQ